MLVKCMIGEEGEEQCHCPNNRENNHYASNIKTAKKNNLKSSNMYRK